MDIDKKERQVLLGKSEPVTITEPIHWFWKKFGFKDRVRTIDIQPLPYGVVLQITSSLAEIDEPSFDTIKDLSEFFLKNEKHVTDVIAYALNCKPENTPPKKLKKFIRKNLTTVQATEIFYFIFEQTNIVNFTSAIRWTTKKLVAEKTSEVPPE